MTEVMDEVTQASTRPSSTEHAPTRPSTTQLVQRALEQMTRLMRDEIALARAEMASKAKQAAAGAGLFSGAAVFGFFAFGCLITAAVLGLALVLPGWAAALIVAGALLLIAGILALVGRGRMKKASQPLPQQAMDGVKTDIAVVRKAMSR
ncbi:MAG TPA: phage holin family protein [Candidatus Stackebrandtia excrementipullorum]|nr:phage holin family protein [Candidatus Stackebrandtia excrementipullorum]